MAETVLDSLVVRIAADTRGLETGLHNTTSALQGLQTLSARTERMSLDLSTAAGGLSDSLGTAAERASNRMASAFSRMAYNGRLSFEGLKNAALAAVADIAASFLTLSIRNFTGSLFSSLLPGRSGGGAVSPSRAYVVGEHGPELFVPHSPGRITTQPMDTAARGMARTTNITVNVQGGGDPVAVRQSAAQVALAVRRALSRADRSL